MKKYAYWLAVVFLIAVLVGLVRYNSVMIKKQSQELSQTDQTASKVQVPETTDDRPTIYCIGDSLTMNTEVKSYAAYLEDLTGYRVETFGGMQDTSQDLAIRTGAMPVYVQGITIPGGTEPVEITLYNGEHEAIDALHHEGSNFKEVSIQGISGTLTYDENTKTHVFTRSQAGEAAVINDYTQVMTDFPEFKEDSIAVIFSGSYDPDVYMGIFDTINQQYRILEALHTQKYIVVSLTSKRTFNIVNDMNVVLEQNFGEHYLDFRNYLLENGLNDANLSPTAQDQQDLSNRYIPSSLLQSNQLDGNEQFNALLAKQLQEKMLALGYLE